ncbi:sporulation membrane protein YtrI [Bacillus kwashiorkori]|uniref:sporulation membrane protein YtrI n=1 Tax=Bacillus kwashiorkori TaxID=1522318 RepID=UPI00078135E2|nr:sporulation membrane protein YtrI [Bacillus kwashiorkori]
MRIPPFYRLPTFQRFFFGMVLGALVSWLLFLYMFGSYQEEQTKKIAEQKNLIEELEREKRIWQEDFRELNEKNKKLLTVNEIKVKISNAHKYNLDLLSKVKAEESVKEDINMMLAKDLSLVAKSTDLLKKVIENKILKINDKRYRLQIKQITIYTTLTIQLELRLAD